MGLCNYLFIKHLMGKHFSFFAKFEVLTVDSILVLYCLTSAFFVTALQEFLCAKEKLEKFQVTLIVLPS